MKKIIFLFTILLLVMSCGKKQETKTESPAAPAETKEVKKKIGVLIPGPVGYFVAVREGIDKAAAENFRVRLNKEL